MDQTVKNRIIAMIVGTVCIVAIMATYGVIHGASEGNKDMVDACSGILAALGVGSLLGGFMLGMGWMLTRGFD